MKAATVLLLFSATVALSQSMPQAPADPHSFFQSPFPNSPRGMNKPPHFRAPWKSLPVPHNFMPHPAHPSAARPLDPLILRRPPQDAFAQHPSRTPLAHDLYPDLKLLPVELAAIGPAPIAWPNLKIEPIPITWPKLTVNSADILLQVNPSQKQK